MLPKFGRSFDGMINYVNNKVFNLRLDNQKMEIIYHSNFVANHELNCDLFWKDKIHPSYIGFRQLDKDFISHVSLKNFNILSS